MAEEVERRMAKVRTQVGMAHTAEVAARTVQADLTLLDALLLRSQSSSSPSLPGIGRAGQAGMTGSAQLHECQMENAAQTNYTSLGVFKKDDRIPEELLSVWAGHVVYDEAGMASTKSGADVCQSVGTGDGIT